MPQQPGHIQLIVDGHSVDIHKPGHDASELKGYLESDAGFAAFKADPKSVLADRNLSISDGLAEKLKEALAPIQSLSDLTVTPQRFTSSGSDFTAYAIAQGAYSMANTKILAHAVSSIIGGV